MVVLDGHHAQGGDRQRGPGLQRNTNLEAVIGTVLPAIGPR
jgi:hypothetical protein